jgi:hypothetical protein
MHEQNAFEFLPRQLKLPSQDPGGDHRKDAPLALCAKKSNSTSAINNAMGK